MEYPAVALGRVALPFYIVMVGVTQRNSREPRRAKGYEYGDSDGLNEVGTHHINEGIDTIYRIHGVE